MADLKAFTEQISTAQRGETVRDAIINAIQTMNRDGVSAEYMYSSNPNNKTKYYANYFAKVSEVNEGLIKGKIYNTNLFESRVVKGSSKGITSDAVYWCYKRLLDELNDLLGDDDGY